MSKNLVKKESGLSYVWESQGLLDTDAIMYINKLIDTHNYEEFIRVRKLLKRGFPNIEFLPEAGIDDNGNVVNILSKHNFSRIDDRMVGVYPLYLAK